MFIVTNDEDSTAEEVIKHYCARGNMDHLLDSDDLAIPSDQNTRVKAAPVFLQIHIRYCHDMVVPACLAKCSDDVPMHMPIHPSQDTAERIPSAALQETGSDLPLLKMLR